MIDMPCRSKKVVFLPFCLLCQAAKAGGLARTHPAVVEELISLFEKNDINVVQMPCPEMLGEGLDRAPQDITYYERQEFLSICDPLAEGVAGLVERFEREGFETVALVGIERSPSCSLGHVKREGRVIPGRGVFMKCLLDELERREIRPVTISVDIGAMDDAIAKVKKAISTELLYSAE